MQALGPVGPARVAAAPLRADVVRHLERATRASEFHRTGRHAAAERLLRDVAGSLVRRDACAAAATTFIALGRILLERGRAGAAEKAFDEAAHCAQSAGEETSMLDARLWQAAARTDAARLTDAESLAWDCACGASCAARRATAAIQNRRRLVLVMSVIPLETARMLRVWLRRWAQTYAPGVVLSTSSNRAKACTLGIELGPCNGTVEREEWRQRRGPRPRRS